MAYKNGDSSETVNTCEACENKELCPVYMGQGCLLVQEHKEELQAN